MALATILEPLLIVAMGGVVTNMTAVRHRLAVYDPAIVQGTVLDRAEIDRRRIGLGVLASSLVGAAAKGSWARRCCIALGRAVEAYRLGPNPCPRCARSACQTRRGSAPRHDDHVHRL